METVSFVKELMMVPVGPWLGFWKESEDWTNVLAFPVDAPKDAQGTQKIFVAQTVTYKEQGVGTKEKLDYMLESGTQASWPREIPLLIVAFGRNDTFRPIEPPVTMEDQGLAAEPC